MADQTGVKRSVSILGKNKRATSAIGTDQRALGVIPSELALHFDADRALDVFA